jgi:phenylalanyl-tRNA synthetase beta subunit
MNDRLSKTEITKDVLQESVEAVASTVGEVTHIITTAVKDVAASIGGLATDAFEIRDSARKARAQLDLDDDVDVDLPADVEDVEDVEDVVEEVRPVDVPESHPEDLGDKTE